MFTADDRDLAVLVIPMPPAPKASGHPLQLVLSEGFIGAGRFTPPVTKSSALLADRKVAIENDPVHTVIVA